MSLLEDVFLEDEAGEAQDLERIIEGDEYDERPRSLSDSEENSEKEDEAGEDKRRVDPASTKTKRVIRNPRFVLNPARLTGPRGMQVLPEHFKEFKFKGKGHEREDLDLLLKNLEHWAYRLYPKFKFEDCLKKIETLGKKRAVSVHLTKLRLGMITSEETVVQQDSSDDELAPAANVEEDEFDKLLQQQIDIARATPGPGSVKKTPYSDRPPLLPKATSSPSINDEQRERMLLNRKKAEERRLARLKQNTSQVNTTDISDNATENSSIRMKHNVSVIDKSGENDGGNTEITDNRKKVNMSVIDSDEDMMVNVSNKPENDNKSVTIELDTESVTKDLVTHETVEIDDGFVVSNNYVPAKKHNKFVMVKSGDYDALVVNEHVTIDVEQHNKTSKSAKNIALESSDEDDVNPITVDNKSRKINKSNVIDSSDGEDEIVMNESIDVDIHSNKSNEDSNIASKDNTESNSSNKSSKHSNTYDGETNKIDNCYSGHDNTSKNKLEVSDENDVAMKIVIEKQADKEKTNTVDLKNCIIDEMLIQNADIQADNKQENESRNPIDNQNNKAENPTAVLSDNAKTIEVGKNVVTESDAIEDMMEVDFGDDF